MRILGSVRGEKKVDLEKFMKFLVFLEIEDSGFRSEKEYVEHEEEAAISVKYYAERSDFQAFFK